MCVVHISLWLIYEKLLEGRGEDVGMPVRRVLLESRQRMTAACQEPVAMQMEKSGQIQQIF